MGAPASTREDHSHVNVPVDLQVSVAVNGGVDCHLVKESYHRYPYFPQPSRDIFQNFEL